MPNPRVIARRLPYPRFMLAFVAIGLMSLPGVQVHANSAGDAPTYHATPNVYCGGPARAGDVGAITLSPAVMRARDRFSNVAEVDTVAWASRILRLVDDEWRPVTDWVWQAAFSVDESGRVLTDSVIIGGDERQVQRVWNVPQAGFYGVEIYFYWYARADGSAPAEDSALIATGTYLWNDAAYPTSSSSSETDWCHFVSPTP